MSGVDLQNANHEEAVQAIKTASSPVVFIVQSLSSTPRVNRPFTFTQNSLALLQNLSRACLDYLRSRYYQFASIENKEYMQGQK